jgi:hypothetical protein
VAHAYTYGREKETSLEGKSGHTDFAAFGSLAATAPPEAEHQPAGFGPPE